MYESKKAFKGFLEDVIVVILNLLHSLNIKDKIHTTAETVEVIRVHFLLILY